jgi:hypothetical protein
MEMSDYEDLMLQLKDQDLLIESMGEQMSAYLRKREVTQSMALLAKAREEDKSKEAEFIPGELVLVRDIDNFPWRLAWFKERGIHGGAYVEFPGSYFLGASHYNYFKRPQDVPDVFIRHAGNERPVSDLNARVVVLAAGYGAYIETASEIEWNNSTRVNKIIGYVIISNWAKELIK